MSMPSVGITVWETSQFLLVSDLFFFSLQPPSTAPSTGASLVRKSSVLRAASALGIINEKPQPIVYTPRRAWITQPTTVSKRFSVVVLCRSAKTGKDDEGRTYSKIASTEAFLCCVNNPNRRDDFVACFSFLGVLSVLCLAMVSILLAFRLWNFTLQKGHLLIPFLFVFHFFVTRSDSFSFSSFSKNLSLVLLRGFFVCLGL